MFEHGNLEAMLAFVALLNIITGIILYREEKRTGITAGTGTRRKAIMACSTMCILAGALAMGLMFYDIMASET